MKEKVKVKIGEIKVKAGMFIHPCVTCVRRVRGDICACVHVCVCVCV